jgi:hypothetical protein
LCATHKFSLGRSAKIVTVVNPETAEIIGVTASGLTVGHGASRIFTAALKIEIRPAEIDEIPNFLEDCFPQVEILAWALKDIDTDDDASALLLPQSAMVMTLENPSSRQATRNRS